MSKSKITAGVISVLALCAATAAFAAPKSPTITVTDGSSGLAASSTGPTAGFTSHFSASGCGFRANDDSYYLVVRGPGLYTSGLTTWADHFSVGSDGCGSGSPGWSSSGLTGTFDVYVVRSPSGNPWSAQPVSNTVAIYISSL